MKLSQARSEIDLFKYNSPTDGRAYWPERKSLPSTQGIWLGWIIECCWDGKFRSAHSLMQALDSVDLGFPSMVDEVYTPPYRVSIKDYMRDRPTTTIIGVLGFTMFIFMIGRRAFLMS